MSSIPECIELLKGLYYGELSRVMGKLTELNVSPFIDMENRSPEEVEWWKQSRESQIATAMVEYSAVEKKLRELERIERSPNVREYLGIPALAKFELGKEVERLQRLFKDHLCDAVKAMGPHGEESYGYEQIAVANSYTETIKVVRQKIASLDA